MDEITNKNNLVGQIDTISSGQNHVYELRAIPYKVILAMTIVFSTGCSTLFSQLSDIVFPANPNSNHRKNEASTITLHLEKTPDEIKKEMPQYQTAAAIPVAPLAGLFIGEIESLLKEEAKKYSASYSATMIGDYFFDGWSPGASTNIKTIEFKREVASDKIPAMQACFNLVPTMDNVAFGLVPTNIVIRKAKAKLIAVDWLAPLNFDLLNPWEFFTEKKYTDWKPFGFDNDIDITIRVSLYGIWRDSDNKVHNELIGTQEFKRENIKVDPDSEIKDCNVIKHNEVLNSLSINSQYTDSLPALNFPTVPRTQIDNGVFSPGNFIINVLVTETDKYSERVKELGTKVEEHKSGIIDRISDQF